MRPEQNLLLEGLGVISQIFWGPSVESCEHMLAPPFLQRLESLREISNGDLANLTRELASTIRGFSDADTLYQHLETGYIRLFVSTKEGIKAPLYESCYQFPNAPLMGKPAIHMKERFEAKGLSTGDNINEPPDHLSIELEYLYFLLEKGWREGDTALVAEAKNFASEIMLPWVSEFRERLATERECRFYTIVAEILTEILEVIALETEAAS
jgi:TorA-specific chaperone